MSFWLNCRVLAPSLPLLLPHKGPFGQQSSLFWDEISVLGGSRDGHDAMTAGGQAGGGQDLGVPWGPLLAAGPRGALSVWVLGWGSHRPRVQLLAPRPRYGSNTPRAGTALGTSSLVPPCVWTTAQVPDTAIASSVPTRPCKPVPETSPSPPSRRHSRGCHFSWQVWHPHSPSSPVGHRGTDGGCLARRVTGLPLFFCSSHRLLSNNKITVLENGSFFGLRALEKL